MARGTCTFRQRDVTAMLKAVKAAGSTVAKIESDKDGKIVVVLAEPITGAPGEPPEKGAPVTGARNEWDEALQ